MKPIPDHAHGRTLTPETVDRRAAETALAPTRRACEEAGARVTESPGGEWSASFGHLKNGVQIVGEMTRPWRRAQTERTMNDPTRPRLKPARMMDGRVVSVVETREDAEGEAGRILPVRRRARFRVPGNRVRRGIEGRMLWRWDGDYWEPTGREYLSGPRLPKRGLQVDPAGGVWRGFSHGWERVS